MLTRTLDGKRKVGFVNILKSVYLYIMRLNVNKNTLLNV